MVSNVRFYMDGPVNLLIWLATVFDTEAIDATFFSSQRPGDPLLRYCKQWVWV
jgi:hypothetical protein